MIRHALLGAVLVPPIAAHAAAQVPEGSPGGSKGPSHIGSPALTRMAARPTDVVVGEDGAPIALESVGGGLRAGSRTALVLPGGTPSRPSGLARVSADDGFAWCDEEQDVVVHHRGDGEAVLLAGPEVVSSPLGLDVRGSELAVADAGGRRVLVLDLDAESAPRSLGDGRLSRPTDVAFLADGSLAVTDGDSSRVEVFDASGEWSHGFGGWGGFPGQLAAPQGLDAWNGRLFVADTDNHRIQVFDVDGKLRYSFGIHAVRPGEGDGALHYPSDVAVSEDGSCAWVAEPLDGRLQRFDRAPGEEPEVDPLRAATGPPAAHYGRVADVDGRYLVIAEPESARVALFDLRLDAPPDPVELGGVGSRGRRLGMMLRPTGLALDAARKEVVLADGALRRISRARLTLDPDGPLRQNPAVERWMDGIDLDRLGAGVLDDAARPIVPGALEALGRGAPMRSYALVDLANRRVLELGGDLAPRRVLAGANDGLVAPRDVVQDREGVLWIADPGAHTVWRKTPTEFARVELAEGARPENIGLTGDGRVVYSDTVAHQIVVVGPEGELARWGGAAGVEALSPSEAWTLGRGLGRLEFSEPAGLGAGERGHLIVVDHGNHRGQILDESGAFVHAFGSRFFLTPMELGR